METIITEIHRCECILLAISLDPCPDVSVLETETLYKKYLVKLQNALIN